VNVLDRFLSQRAPQQPIPRQVESDYAPTDTMTLLDKKAAASHYSKNIEMDRITKIPVSVPMDAERLELFNYYHILGDAYQKGWRLFPTQAQSFCEFKEIGGGFFPVGVGWGKTLITMMCANHAYQNGTKKIMLIVPPEVLTQLITADIQMARRHVPLNMPIHVVGGKSAKYRTSLTNSNKKGLYVMTYSYLSVKDTDDMLDAIRPGLIICDEAHRLKNKNAARTKRLMKYISTYRPAGVCLSGTITSKSVRDYYHLIRWCLGPNNPLPNTASLANEWAAVIDAGGEILEGQHCNTISLLPLVEWALTNFPKEKLPQNVAGFRKAYKSRLTTTPGVHSSGDLDIKVSLVIQNVPVENYESRQGWSELEELIRQVEEENKTPNGDEIDHAIHKWKWFNELTVGFYNELVWPTTEKYAQRKSISVGEAEDILDRARLYFEASQDYQRSLRSWLGDKQRTGMDTPDLVGLDMYQHGADNVGSELYDAWAYRKALDFEDRPDRDSKAVRVCDYKINQGLNWAKEHVECGGIIWVMHQEIGTWMMEVLREAGLDAVHCPAGDRGNKAILNSKNAGKILVTSIPAHCTGKNVQDRFCFQKFLEWPRNPIQSEQILGRLHRNGQKADEVVACLNGTIDFDFLAFAACLNDALYIHQTTGNRQKLIYASYDPLPKIMPSEVLRERGLQNKQLNREQKEMMLDKFGS